MGGGLLAAILLVLAGCAGQEEKEPLPLPVFAEVARQAGIDFAHFSGASGRYYFLEAHGAGAAFVDFDGDGWVDLYAVNGAPLPGFAGGEKPADALYRNRGDGSFAEVGATLGIADSSYGMGACAGDYDNDGDADLYVTNFGPNALYRNESGRGFTELGAEAGVADVRLSTSAAFADYDRDGDLDLYVANNVRIDLSAYNKCRHGTVQVYCGPLDYPGESGALYRNEGEGRFVDVTEEAGLYDESGRQLAVVWGDYDVDGDPDLYVANDMRPNFLFRNDGGAHFAEVGVEAGVALNPDGDAEAGMGTDWGDYDGDGRFDLVVCNFQWESCRLHANLGNGFFEDRTVAAGLSNPTYSTLTFGTDLLDYDNDGWLDLFIANGHIEPSIEIIDGARPTYAQHDQLFRNSGRGTFAEVSEEAGLRRIGPMVGRGSATADYDNDGDVDIYVANNNQRPLLLRNDGGNRNHWLSIRTRGRRGNRDGIGARVEVVAGGRRQIEEVRSASSYLSQNDVRLHFGLGRNARAERVEIRWPGGGVQVLEGVAANQFLVVEEP